MVNYDQSGMSLPSLLSLTKVLTLIGCEQELGIDKTTLIIPASSLPTPLTTMRTPVSRTSTADPRTDSARTHTLPASNLRDLGTHLLRLAHWRALSEGIDLSRLRACAAEKECRAGLSTNACQPRAWPSGCARSSRTCRTDRGPRDGDGQD